MADRHPLQDINDFPSLVEYLRDELDWPIESESFDDLTFDFAPEELGLKPDEAAKVRDVKQLRPLTTNQPWGIFFVNFEPKRLPVVALRKILGNLVVKKRASANRAELASWKLHDLLFISAFGAGDDRQITLAHFSEGAGGDDIPTLKVLGWDELDTHLNLQHVDRQMHERLCWPEDAADLDTWREQWSAAFTLRHRHVIATAQELAVRLAVLAQSIRQKVQQVLDIETDAGPLRKLYAAFREALIHDLSEDDFADMYAQTITYGLFSAAVSRTTPDAGTVVLPENLADMVPITNPFLREMLSTFLTVGGRKGKLDFDELGIQEVVEVLNSPDTNLTAVVRNFGDRRQGEDPVIHFYEDFLKQYDKKRKVERGVFYTPQPVVSYIVRSVHELLQTEFGLEDGLASTVTWGEMVKRHKELSIPEGAKAEDPFVVILDPATGTATFLVEVVDVIHRTMKEKWKRERLSPAQQRDAWNQYVPAHLLPRLYGYELMMAPYAIAHMKIGLKLGETGYRFQSDERARIYLTNALEPPSDLAAHAAANLFEALGHEAQAVNSVKRNQRFTVLIGNPPYSNFGQLNRIPFILNLLSDYKKGLNEKKINLDDDFIKFIRFCQHLLDQTGSGVFGMITNNAFFDGPTHRRMRESLCTSFGSIRAINLHGSLKKGETAPDGGKDENVFDITVGVGISIYTKAFQQRCAVAGDLYGSRDSKYERLMSRTPLRTEPLSLAAPEFYFVPKDFSLAEEYRSAPSVPDIFPSGISGIKTHRDQLLVDYSSERLVERFQEIARNPDVNTLKGQLGVKDTAYWTLADAKRHIREATVKSKVNRYFYRPFDYRHIFYEPKIIERGDARWNVMQHMLHANLALICTRQTNPGHFTEILVSNSLVDKRALASFAGEARAYPLYIYEDELSFDSDKRDVISARSKTSRPNLSPSFLKSLAEKLRLSQIRPHGLPTGMTPEDIFHYAYAVFHSPVYRSRYAEFLKIDFPRLPLTGNLELFRTLARLGGELTALHLLESPLLNSPRTKFIGDPGTEINRVAWCDETVWIDAPSCRKGAMQQPGAAGFHGLPEVVWNFHVGGYQVCHKWLKDRKGGALSADDIAHYHKIVVALAETIRLMAEIDDVIEQHGGWPDAFVTEPADVNAVDDNQDAATFE